MRRRRTEHDDYGSAKDREQEGPSPPILETSAVADQRETGEKAGDGEELESGVDEVSKTSI